MQSNIKNRNGRIYPLPILQKEFDRYNEEYVKKDRAVGELGHPDGPSINQDRVSHKIVELKQDGDNFVGKAKILGTPMGNIVKEFIDEGIRFGVSSRGLGSLKENRDGIMEVQDDFYLATAGDIVSDPSAPDAFVNGIMEGVDFFWTGGKLEKAAAVAKADIEEAAKARSLDRMKKVSIFETFIRSI
jgi:hypothetical protein